MRTIPDVLRGYESLLSGPGPYFVSNDDDEECTIWHDSGRAARLLIEESVLYVRLFYGSDPWGSVAGAIAITEEDAFGVTRAWCETETITPLATDGQSFQSPVGRKNSIRGQTAH